MSSRSYILQVMLWHQSLKSIHHRTLLIFQNKKNNRFEGQNMGGIKDMLSPPCQNMGGIYHPHPPQDLRPWYSCRAMGNFRKEFRTYVYYMELLLQLIYF